MLICSGNCLQHRQQIIDVVEKLLLILIKEKELADNSSSDIRVINAAELQ